MEKTAPPPAIELRGVTKRFGSVTANDHVDLTVNRGEVLCLLGENGSGKTTLMNILSGLYLPDEGEVLLDGAPVSIRSPADAAAHGIGMIHQHFKLVDVFTAAENIVLGLDGKLDRRAAAGRAREIAARYGFDIDPGKKIYDMSVSEKQTVEIVKTLYRGADILILDEPTAVLTPQETERLFAVLRDMRRDGKAVILITHKLHEVLDVSDRVAVLRKGQAVGTVPTAQATPQSLTELMVGHAVSLNIARPLPVNPVPRLDVRGLTCRDSAGVVKLRDVSFTALGGEILGVAGVAGSGQRELLEAIAGLCPAEGSVRYFPPAVDGNANPVNARLDKEADASKGGNVPKEKIEKSSVPKPIELLGRPPMEIRKAGVTLAFVPEDRLGMGLVGGMGMTGNMLLRSWHRGRGLFVNRREPKALAERVRERLDVATPGTGFPVRRLSGGNVQKVLLGREIASSPAVLMTAYAVRGLDIHTSYTIYNLMTEQKQNGAAVIYVGEDLDVLLELCDRILVLCGGQVSGIVDGRTATKEQVGLLMTRVGGENVESAADTEGNTESGKNSGNRDSGKHPEKQNGASRESAGNRKHGKLPKSKPETAENPETVEKPERGEAEHHG